jgi:hypothetical protein
MWSKMGVGVQKRFKMGGMRSKMGASVGGRKRSKMGVGCRKKSKMGGR